MEESPCCSEKHVEQYGQGEQGQRAVKEVIKTLAGIHLELFSVGEVLLRETETPSPYFPTETVVLSCEFHIRCPAVTGTPAGKYLCRLRSNRHVLNLVGTFAPLEVLHRTHAAVKLSIEVAPPLLHG